MILSGARVARSATEASHTDISIRRGRLLLGGAPGKGRRVDLGGYLILPGLINAHDHLEFNLFPRLGRGRYPNSKAWAEDIYHPDESPVKEQLSVPKPMRLFWGGIKNLVSGVTWVAHHNPYDPKAFTHKFPVRVAKNYGWAHSVHFSADWLSRFRRTPRRAPFLIHLAEGTDPASRSELQELEAGRALSPSTVLVHGVALTCADVDLLRRRKASLVWCPSSNCFLLGRTVCPGILLSEIPIALGTDSALSGDGDLIDELRKAGEFVDTLRRYRMVTCGAARILRLASGAGQIKDGGGADLVIVRDDGQTAAETLSDLRPEAVIVNGRLNLVSEALAERFPLEQLGEYERIGVEGRGSWRLPFPMANLIAATRRALGGELRLAGRAVSA
jgi:cytosine/adenosine deaminase-related metal-dependent hydrolase